MTMTHRERIEREGKVKTMLEEGLTINQMARELDLAPQSVQRFLKVRGWQTNFMKAQSPTNVDPKKEERKAARRAMKKERP